MRAAGALILAIGGLLWVRRLGADSGNPSAATALALGFTLLAAWITSDVLRHFRIPRITGYLLFGIVVGPYLGGVIDRPMAAQLQTITGLATTLIALIAGLTLNFERMGRRLVSIAQMTGVMLTLALAGVFALAWFAWPFIPIAPDATGIQKLMMIGLLSVMVVSLSPTMTAAVIAESGARGKLSDTVLATVLIADLVLLVLFSGAIQLARIDVGGAATPGVELLVRIVWELGGAVAFGVLVGAVFALYMRYIGREVTLALLAVCALLSQVGSIQQFEPLLAAVAAGLVIENLAVAQGDTLRAAVRSGGPPVLLVFFVAIGASLSLDALAIVGPIALGLSAVRIGLIRLGTIVGVRLSGIDPVVGSNVWTGLVSQAGITLGFASVVATEFPGWGNQMQLLLIASLAFHELAGPILFRRGLLRSGDLEARQARRLLVVSNREPYIHEQGDDGAVTWKSATGGVAVALDALMRERGGVWIAHGGGSADRAVADEAGRVLVPPDAPSYTLKRLWLEEPTFSSYYGGFANEGLWPLSHLVDVRPKFRSEDWAAYRDVNSRFAEAIDQELGDSTAPVFIQDYHLALVAPALRARRPNAATALFWHIPWPYPDRLRICPWSHDLLAGLLANDLLAFQVERDRRNFLLAVEEELNADIDLEASRVHFGGRYTTVVAVPIGVDYDRIQTVAHDDALAAEQQRLRELLRLDAPIIGLGVDRLDYTKGIPERLAALDALLTRRPDLRGRLTFVQIGVPSRSELDSYAAIEAEIGQRIRDMNKRHAGGPGTPPLVTYHNTALSAFSLVALYRLADFCVVSSLHDGMNLVAKEFVASRDDEDGVLVLSALAGAAQELSDALIINPYDIDGFADAIARALDMPLPERMRRMRAMRRVVAGRDVFSWASDILEGLETLWTRPLHYSVRGWEEMAV